MRPLRLSIGLAIAIPASAAALAAAVPVTVNQVHRSFSTREVHVSRGDTVRFSNLDEFLHQIYVTSSAFNFSSPEQSPGQYVDVTFSTKGTFDVRCEIHPKMVVSVTVD